MRRTNRTIQLELLHLYDFQYDTSRQCLNLAHNGRGLVLFMILGTIMRIPHGGRLARAGFRYVEDGRIREIEPQ